MTQLESRTFWTDMEQNEPVRDAEIEAEADDIAATITKILVKAFTAKEGRDPTSAEVEMLIDELTEERIESLLNGTNQEEDVSDSDASDEEKEQEEQEEEGEDGVSNVEEVAVEVPVILDASVSCKRHLDGKMGDKIETENENADSNGQNKKLKTSGAEESAEVL